MDEYAKEGESKRLWQGDPENSKRKIKKCLKTQQSTWRIEAGLLRAAIIEQKNMTEDEKTTKKEPILKFFDVSLVFLEMHLKIFRIQS